MSFNLNPSNPKSSSQLVDAKPKKKSVIEFQMDGEVKAAAPPKQDITHGRHRAFIILSSLALFVANAGILFIFVIAMVYKFDMWTPLNNFFGDLDPAYPPPGYLIAYLVIATVLMFSALIVPAIIPKFGRGGFGYVFYLVFVGGFAFSYIFGVYNQKREQYGYLAGNTLIYLFISWLNASFGLFVTSLFAVKRVYKEIGLGVTLALELTMILLLNFYAKMTSRQPWEYFLYVALALALSFYYSKDLELIVVKRGQDFFTNDWFLGFVNLHTDITFKFWFYLFKKPSHPHEASTELDLPEEGEAPIA